MNGSKDIFHNTPKPAVAGTASWTFNWTAPATGSATITFNAAGNATDGDGTNSGDKWNFFSTTLIKNPAPVLTVTATSTTISCNGGLSTITATGTNGLTPYQYKLNSGIYQSSNVFTGNVAGLYTITIKDATNATASATRNVTQPTLITFGTPAVTPPLCNGGNGSISNTATGGSGTTKTYTIAPSGPLTNTTGNFAGLLAQTYTINVTDGNGCTKSNIVALGQPSPIIFNSPVITNPSCYGGTGGVTLVATGGTGISKTYSITPLGPQTNTTGTFTGLTAQSYTITASDANNCSKTSIITITQPAPLTVTASNVSGCPGTFITLSGTPAGGIFSVPNPYSGPSTTYTYTYTNGNGCSASSAPATITVAPCNAVLNTKLFLGGYYLGAGYMVPVLMNQGVGNNPNDVDSILIELKDPITFTTVYSSTALLHTNGMAFCDFGPISGSYYIAISHRNGILTWSAAPVLLSSGITNYDFTNAASQAYGNNMKEFETGIWIFYSGDLNGDENIDLLDLGIMELDINNFEFGYFKTDINGDGNVDLLDSPSLESNINDFIYSNHP
ncbi:mucin-19 [Filimonas sp.]|nr:mucin-19 [Filimonas sp.]